MTFEAELVTQPFSTSQYRPLTKPSISRDLVIFTDGSQAITVDMLWCTQVYEGEDCLGIKHILYM